MNRHEVSATAAPCAARCVSPGAVSNAASNAASNVSIATPARKARLSATAAFYLQASITTSCLAGSAAPTPLYSIYQAQWGFSPIVITSIFGIYAAAVLVTLLICGRLSDHIGRRPVLIVATMMQIAAMVALGTADGLSGLMIGRVIQGLSAGAAVAAVGAGLVDINKERGTVANSIAPIMGTATGGLLGGLMVHFLPAPTHLVYLLLGIIFVLQTIGVFLMPETISPRDGALASLKPQFAVPTNVRARMLLATPALVAAWALAGYYASLAPVLMKRIFGVDPSLAGGIALFTLAASGGVAVLLLHKQHAHRMMTIGSTALLVGVAFVLLALSMHSEPVFFLGTVIAGVGFGSGFQGAIRMVLPQAAPHDRAGVLSVIFVVSYVTMALPAVIAGAVIAHGGGVLPTAREFGIVVMGLATLALAGLRLPHARS